MNYACEAVFFIVALFGVFVLDAYIKKSFLLIALFGFASVCVFNLCVLAFRLEIYWLIAFLFVGYVVGICYFFPWLIRRERGFKLIHLFVAVLVLFPMVLGIERLFKMESDQRRAVLIRESFERLGSDTESVRQRLMYPYGKQ